MTLGFKKQFKPKILNGTKIHTIRRDEKNRWKAGNKIHFATGVRTKNYNQFAPVVEVKSIQHIHIHYSKTPIYRFAIVDGRQLDFQELEQLAINDGFNGLEDFFDWFNEDFTGKIIHWTDYKY